MELDRITKINISRTTGLPISELLEKKPVADARLEKLQRQQIAPKVDILVRGNPQLTVGRVTSIESVEAYFSKKEKSGLEE